MLAGRTNIAIPPGETIVEQLERYGMDRSKFADLMSMSHEEIERLIDGQMILSQEIAAQLEQTLGPPAQFWMNLETIYREDIGKVQKENARNQLRNTSAVQIVKQRTHTARAQV